MATTPVYCPKPKTQQKQRDSLTTAFILALRLSVPQRPENTLMMKKNVLDFQRKKGAGHGEKRLKDMF